MFRPSCVFVLASILSAPAAAQSLGYFPAARTHADQFLRRPFRVPLEALLEVNSPTELARLSVSPIPRFASAPVTSIESNPFGNATSPSTTTPSGGGVLDDYPAEIGSASASPSDPFGGSVEGGDPFAEIPASSADPFDAGAGDADPFADPGPGADNADPFADSGDDPFGI